MTRVLLLAAALGALLSGAEAPASRQSACPPENTRNDMQGRIRRVTWHGRR